MITAKEAMMRQYDFLRYQRRQIGIGVQYRKISDAMRWLKKRIKEEMR